ncbi:MAG: TIGR02466 family protein [Polynucleobacter sp.]
MQLTKCFSVPFWQTQLNFDATAVAAKCMQMKDSGYSNRTVSNRGGWQSTNFDINAIEEFGALSSEINQNLKLIATSIHDSIILKPMGAWVNINQKGSLNVVHNHSSYRATLSAVVYIQVDENTGRIYFEDNFSPMVYYPHMLPAKRKLFLTKEYFIPTTGMMLTFPAWIPHGVEPSRSDLTRISIAFNISVGER